MTVALGVGRRKEEKEEEEEEEEEDGVYLGLLLGERGPTGRGKNGRRLIGGGVSCCHDSDQALGRKSRQQGVEGYILGSDRFFFVRYHKIRCLLRILQPREAV